MSSQRNKQANLPACLSYFSGELILDSASVGHIVAQRSLG